MFQFLQRKKDSNIIESEFLCQRGKLTIRGTQYKPAGENLPIAIVSHGFMAFQDTVRHYAKALAENGYISYCFDFCGGCVMKGKSDGATTEMSVLTEVMDLEAVIEYAKKQPGSNPDRVLLMGCSQGGFVSAITAARHKGEIEKLVLFYPALCIPDDARAGKMMFAKFDPENIPEVIQCGPMKLGRCYAADVIGMDPYQEIEGYDGDVLLIHGTNDNIVKLGYSEKANEVYHQNPNRTGKLEFIVIEKGGHGFSKRHDKIAIEYMREFV